MAQDRLIKFQLLEEVLLYLNMKQFSFSKAEFTDAISKYNNSSTPGPNYIS